MKRKYRRLPFVVALLATLAALPVAAAADDPSDDGALVTPPTLSGAATVGETLTVQPGTWTTDGDDVIDGYLYQWLRCDPAGANCSSISGATSSSYALTDADLGGTLEGRVIQVTTEPSGDEGDEGGDDDHGHGDGDGAYTYLSQPGFSAPSAVVAAPPTAPVSSGEPKITVEAPNGRGTRIVGTSQVGDTLVASPGSWSGTGPITFTYEWLRCDRAGEHCVTIKGATGSSYRLTRLDAGHTIRVVVTARNPIGSTRAESSETSSVTLVPILHISELVRPTSGTVCVTLPGRPTCVKLTRSRLIPDGSTVDTSAGSVAMEVAADRRHHYYHAQLQGASFVVHQLHGSHPLTQFRLLTRPVCPAADPAIRRAPIATVARRHRRHRKTLWAHDNGGRFTTQGQYGSAIVRGTTWTTTNTCEGTSFHVIAGRIVVHDQVKHRYVVVSAGHSYMAWAPEPKGTRQDI